MELLADLLVTIVLYSLFFISLNNFILGKIGFWPVGHVAFFGLGALVTGWVSVGLGWPPTLGLVIACLIAGILAGILSLSTASLRGDYFIMVSVALAEMVRILTEYIAGPGGYSGVPRPVVLKNNWVFLFIASFLLGWAIWAAVRFRQLPLERIGALLRTTDVGARLAGIDTSRFRAKLFILGSVMAALSGSLFSMYTSGTDPQRMTLQQAVILFAMVLFGGIDSIRGSVIGATTFVCLMVFLEYLFRNLYGLYAAQLSSVLFGLILIGVTLFSPYGLMGRRGTWIYDRGD